MQNMIDALTAYFSTNGTLADAVNFVQLVGAEAWGSVSKLYHVIQG